MKIPFFINVSLKGRCRKFSEPFCRKLCFLVLLLLFAGLIGAPAQSGGSGGSGEPGGPGSGNCLPSVSVQYQTSMALLSKCNFQEYTNQDLPRIHWYHNQATHWVFTDQYSDTGTNSSSGDSYYGGNGADWSYTSGPYSSQYNDSNDVTFLELAPGPYCSYTNIYSGFENYTLTNSDSRNYHWANENGCWNDWGNGSLVTDVEQRNFGWASYSGATQWCVIDLSATTSTNGYADSACDGVGGSCSNCFTSQLYTNISPASAVLGSVISTYGLTRTQLTPIEQVYTPATSPDYSTTSSQGEVTTYTANNSFTMTLDTEYTDRELYTNILGLIPGYSGVWSDGSDLWSSVAYSAIGADHADGSPWTIPMDPYQTRAALQEMEYRFNVPGSLAGVEYQITWDVVTYDIWQGVLSTASSSTTVLGNGTNVYSGVYQVNPPYWDQSDYGGYVFGFVNNVQISVVPRSTAVVGTGPGWGVGVAGSACSTCSGNSSGAIRSTTGGAYATFSMGRAMSEYSAGQLRIWSDQPSPLLSTPATLSLTAANSGIEVIQSSGQLRQVNAPQALADIVTNDAYSYVINYYLPSQVGSLVGGVHQLSGSPFISWLVINPDGAAATNRIQLIETNGTQVSTYECDYDAANGSWKYEYPGGLREDEVDTVNAMNDQGSATTVTWTTRVPGGQDQYKFRRVYQTYCPTNGYNVPQGPYLVQQTFDPDNHPKTTTYIYNWGNYANGTTRPLDSVAYSDGFWEKDMEFDAQGRPQIIYSPLQNMTLAEGSFGEDNYTEYDYAVAYVSGSGDDGTMYPNLPRRIVHTVNNVQFYTFTVFPNHFEKLDIVGYSGNWNDQGNITTTTTYYSTGLNTNRVQSVLHPDGTMQIYTYTNAADGTETNIVYSGVPNSGHTAIVDGTETITVVGPVGQMVSSTQIDIASGITTAQDTYGNYDPFSRPQTVTHLDGTSETTTYSCCGVDTTVDRDGVTTYYQYDAAKRLINTTRLGITTSYALDSLGHVLMTTRTGTDNSIVTLNQSGYDLSGELVAETNGLGGVTIYSQSVNSFGGLTRTTTYPDTGTRVEQYNLDRSLASVTGTAVHGKAYAYGSAAAPNLSLPFGCTFITETNLHENGNSTGEWTQTYTDPFGRTVEVFYPGDWYVTGSGQYFSGPSSLFFYNSIGQLTNQMDADGVSTLTQFGPRGDVAYTAVDMNLNGVIDWSGPDRITWTTNDLCIDHGVAVDRTRSYVWLDGQSSGTLTSESETSVDGLKAWQISFITTSSALTNETITSYSGTNRAVTSIAADGSYTINSYSSGRLISSTRFDASNNSIGSTSYTYDAHGRQYQVTDARNGSTTYGYNAADQVTSVTTPTPGNGHASETTTTLYDNMLRPYSVIQPDGTTVNSVYLLTGELALQYGSRTYPVGYGYDYAGRMQYMTNWSSFTGLTGARVTTWNYDSQRGWLNSKAYADGNGPSYMYTPAGRLASRAWVRTDSSGNPIITTNSYDASGSLTNIVYSDATPCVTNTYDRLGRLSQQSTAIYQLNSTYNLAGQLLTESWSGGPLNGLTVTNGYDQFQRRTNLTTLASGVLSQTMYGYDAASRLSTVNDGNNNSATYSYVANSPLVSQIVYKQGSTTRMTTSKQYDNLNRLTQISSQPSGSGVPAVAFNYSYNSANQRTQDKLADGSYWVYNYDSLGQVIGGHKYFYDGTPVPGQQFDYGFDDIGNRKQTKAGGDQTGGNQRVANYSVNTLNQITQRDYPGTNDVVGAALATNAVTVNGQTAWRKGEYFWSTVVTNNKSAAQWLGVTVASGGNTTAGNEYLPETPEQFSYDADGNLTNDGRWSYTWDAENRLIGMTVNTNVGPQYQLAFAYDAKGRRIQKCVTNGVAVSTVNFLYDGWNLVADLQPNNSLIRNCIWGSDLSGSMQGAGGVGGLLEVSYYGTSTTNCFAAFDGNGNVAQLVNANDGTSLAAYEYGPFGEAIRATGPMAKANPIRFSTKYQDDESDMLYYGYRYYKPSTGSWLSRDPDEEDGGDNVYGFAGNDDVDYYDIFGLKWTISRNGDETASAEPDAGDTIADLANMIGLKAEQFPMWLTVSSGNTLPSSTSQKMTGCEHFEVPNTVVAYWAGNLGWLGRWYVRWNPNVRYLRSLGFYVDDRHHQDGDVLALQGIFHSRSQAKQLQGFYFWGHGSAPYPAKWLMSASGDAVLQFASPGLFYQMGLGLVFCCDSNSGKSVLMSNNGSAIWNGYTGTLYPWPFKAYKAKDYIHHGDQATH